MALGLGGALLASAACGGTAETTRAPPREITVFAASSLAAAFQEFWKTFEAANPGVKVAFNFAGTSTLRTQLEHGAGADVFASADQVQMDIAKKAGLLHGEPLIFATNLLAVVTRAQGSRVSNLRDLGNDGVRVILVAPQLPAGAYTEAAFKRLEADPAYGLDFVKRVRANVISLALSVAQATSTVHLGEADAAIAYVTDARSTSGAPLTAVPIPARYADRALYPIAVLKGAAAPDLAEQFIDLLRSAPGEAVLDRYGFGRP